MSMSNTEKAVKEIQTQYTVNDFTESVILHHYASAFTYGPEHAPWIRCGNL